MRLRFTSALWLLAFWLALPTGAAQRVISLAPNATELAYAAGMGEVLVAASAYSDYPPQAARLEQVASWQGINLERVLALKPDLILAWRGGNPQRVLDQLAAFGIPIFYADADNPPRRVLLQFGTQPLFTSSGATLQSQVLALCGAQNVFADSRTPWPQISREQVLARQPQAIVITGGAKEAANVKAFWAPQLQVPVIALNEDWFNRGGPRLLLAAQQLCRQLAEIR